MLRLHRKNVTYAGKGDEGREVGAGMEEKRTEAGEIGSGQSGAKMVAARRASTSDGAVTFIRF